MKRCPDCSRTYSDNTLSFCLNDGSLLSAPYDPEATVIINQSPRPNLLPTEILMSNTKPKLRRFSAGDYVETFMLDTDEIVIGRNTGQIRFPEDDCVSSVHARIIRREARFVLIDANSRNGLYKKVIRECELNNGDVILVGTQHFKIELTATGGIDLISFIVGELKGQTFSINNDETVIGRNGADICFPEDELLSSPHARIVCRGNRFILIDESSSFPLGVFKKIVGESELSDGDILLIGVQFLKFEM